MEVSSLVLIPFSTGKVTYLFLSSRNAAHVLLQTSMKIAK